MVELLLQASQNLMFVCKCCGQWKITQHPNGLRITHYGFLIQDVKSTEALATVLGAYGVRLEDLEERDARAPAPEN
jgi:hypothetical protein